MTGHPPQACGRVKTIPSRLIRDSRRLLDQEADQGSQQRLTTLSDVVNELEESQIQGQLLLRDPPVGTQPRAEQRPESLDGIDMDLAETIAILIPGELPGGMTDRSMTVAPCGTIGNRCHIHPCTQHRPGSDRGANQRGDRDLLHVLQHPDHHRPAALDHAEDRGLLLGQRPPPPLPLQPAPSGGPPFFFTASGWPLCPATT